MLWTDEEQRFYCHATLWWPNVDIRYVCTRFTLTRRVYWENKNEIETYTSLRTKCKDKAFLITDFLDRTINVNGKRGLIGKNKTWFCYNSKLEVLLFIKNQGLTRAKNNKYLRQWETYVDSCNVWLIPKTNFFRNVYNFLKKILQESLCMCL